MIYHMTAFLLGFVLDLIVGDPYSLPHPIRWIGSLIAKLEKAFLKKEDLTAKQKRRRGCCMVLLVCLIVEVCVVTLMALAYGIHPFLGVLIETVVTYQMLAAKCLKVESMKVYDRLEHGTLEEARHAVSMIVGRDTRELTSEQVAKAAVETVAENTSDGVIAPMLYLALGGPVLGVLYKTVNTMDSMVGYKNERFLDFGRCAAKLDDVLNYIPSRISAGLMIVSCAFLGKEYDVRNARRIFHRDRYLHASPNSAQTEAVCAGALSVRLAGPASYFGKIVEKPFIGDDIRPIENRDIIRANRLLYMTAFCSELCCLLIMILLYFCIEI